MTVLIITRSDDNDCIRTVTEAIEAQGGSVFRFDTDCFPTQVQLSLRTGKGGDRMIVRSDAGELDLADVTAVWYRRFHAGAKIPETMDKQLRAASIKETRYVLWGMMAGLNVFHVDPLPIVRHAMNKQVQLQLARDVGLETPRTLITNDPDAVRAFARECPEGMVTKMLASFAIYDDGVENVVFTTAVSDEDLRDMQGLDLCPMTFQEKVPKAMELRATVVGDRIFTASIDSQASDRSRIDWRREGAAMVTQWKHYDLPHDVGHKLLALMDRFGLQYGAADFIVTPDGRHVFLEVNPSGEFFWLDTWPGLPISPAIADLLLHPTHRRSTSRQHAHAVHV